MLKKSQITELNGVESFFVGLFDYLEVLVEFAVNVAGNAVFSHMLKPIIIVATNR
jgi:hypothetical protein